MTWNGGDPLVSQDPCHLVILAAGRGHRVGEGTPKQFLDDGRGVTLLEHAVRRACEARRWDSVVVAAPEGHVDRTYDLLDGACADTRVVVAGAPDRMDSLRRALAAVPDLPGSMCVIHDGVRPATPPSLFVAVMAPVLAGEADACWPASAPRDTVLLSNADGDWSVTSARQASLAATPIALRREVLARALVGESPVQGILIDRLTHLGVTWTTVENSSWNLKVTTRDDLDVARILLGGIAAG